MNARSTDSLPRPVVLGIETSCDDTACAVVDGEGRVLASVVSSQLAAHRPYGGVVPEIASREHLANWPRVSEAALETAGLALQEVDAVAATRGPGLVGSLLVGLSLGKSIAYALDLPFHAVHHLEGHLYSPFLAPPAESGPETGRDPGEAPGREPGQGTRQGPAPAEPVPGRFTGLVVSGGHTTLFAVDGDRVETVAETRDDAMGESFDKVGKRLGLAYPQGPRVDSLAELGEDAEAAGLVEPHPFPVPLCGPSLDVSYSGLKSQALLAIERLEARGVRTRPAEDGSFPPEVLALVAGFRRAAVGQLLDRVDRLHSGRIPGPGGRTRAPRMDHRKEPEGGVELLAVSGGAAANRLLRRRLDAWAREHGVPLRLVPLAYAGDNAAMIAHAALLRERRGRRDDPFRAEAASRIPI